MDSQRKGTSPLFYTPFDPSSSPSFISPSPEWDLLHLVVGSADRAQVIEEIRGCDNIRNTVAAEWMIRDSSVAGIAPLVDRPGIAIVGQAPGSTFLVAEAGAFVDSLPVFVPDPSLPTYVRYGARKELE